MLACLPLAFQLFEQGKELFSVQLRDRTTAVLRKVEPSGNPLGVEPRMLSTRLSVSPRAKEWAFRQYVILVEAFFFSRR